MISSLDTLWTQIILDGYIFTVIQITHVTGIHLTNQLCVLLLFIISFHDLMYPQ